LSWYAACHRIDRGDEKEDQVKQMDVDRHGRWKVRLGDERSKVRLKDGY